VGRVESLIRIRYERMSVSPFTFYRGAASIMAGDLQATPASGIKTQICGDAHLLNFGAYASPERRFVFDVNDFDETIASGAWEWDLKRLVTSIEIAGRYLNHKRRDVERSVLATAESYRTHVHAFARLPVLEVWYARVDERLLARAVRSAEARSRVKARETHREVHGADLSYPGLECDATGALRFRERPPLIYRPPDDPHFLDSVKESFERYRRSLALERRALFERFRFTDAAYKVVGVGSVGTRCLVGLFIGADGTPLVLQLKEARASVYARYGLESGFTDQGERVVVGQRLMQAATDLFLGWTEASDGHTYYVRQLRDRKTGADIERMTPRELARYATLCGWALARAHAKASGRAAAIAAYLGRGRTFDDAVRAFAAAYADQNERDYAALLASQTRTEPPPPAKPPPEDAAAPADAVPADAVPEDAAPEESVPAAPLRKRPRRKQSPANGAPPRRRKA
jgi:uncharacterized protein (DUF2252 family)